MIYGTGTFLHYQLLNNYYLCHPSASSWRFAPDSKDSNMEIDME